MKLNKVSSAKERFSHTVEHYVKNRPHYPREVLNILKEQCGLKFSSVIADVGSGTGIFSQLLLADGYQVIGVEPNDEMRKAAEHYLANYANFTSIAAAAEKTTLTDHSVDTIIVATAFHWFEQQKVKKEFKRILKKSGYVVLLWNIRDSSRAGIMQAYEELLQQFGVDYKEVRATKLDERSIRNFFAPNSVETIIIPNEQILDWEGFQGRLLSTSYAPKADAANFNDMISVAKSLFDRYQQNGKITFSYQTKLYIGLFSADYFR